MLAVDVSRVSDSCGYGVPKMEFAEDRGAMSRWAAAKGTALPAYRLEKNTHGIDGLQAPRWTRTMTDHR